MVRIFNFSGHPLTQDTRNELKKEVKEDIFVVDIKIHIDFRSNVHKQIKDAVNPFITEMLKGQFMVALPSMGTLAVLLLTYVNGIIGIFPPMITLKMNGTKQALGYVTDLNKLRNEGRQVRT